MRVFCAVSCGAQLAHAMTTALDGLRSGPLGHLPVRWTRPESWHMTLQFLGEWPESRLNDLKRDLPGVVDIGPFVLNPGELGGFPSLESPRVLFLQMGDGGQAARLAGRVREIVGGCWPEGPQDTRAFRGHLTLGRVPRRLSVEERNLLLDIKFGSLPPVEVEGFSLLASELRPSGPKYTELGFYPLRK